MWLPKYTCHCEEAVGDCGNLRLIIIFRFIHRAATVMER